MTQEIDDTVEPFAIHATVRLRRGDGWDVKPAAEATDGMRHQFTRGWEIEEGDSSIYVGETAWLPSFDGWPSGAPSWIASGDLTDIVNADLASVGKDRGE